MLDQQTMSNVISIDSARRRGDEAIGLLMDGRHAMGLEKLCKAVEMAQGMAGPDDIQTIELLDDLATTLGTLGQHAKAEHVARHVLDWCIRSHGCVHERTAMAMHLVARNLHAQGQFEEAAGLQESALVAAADALGQDHPRTIEIMSQFILFEANRIAASGEKDKATEAARGR